MVQFGPWVRFRTLCTCLVKAHKSCLIIPVLRFVHWLKINKFIDYKLLLLAYKFLTTTHLSYLDLCRIGSYLTKDFYHCGNYNEG